jgi:hypothetical protein
MKKYIYNVMLQDGTQFDYNMDAVTFNHKLEDGTVKTSLITYMSFVKEIEIEDKDVSVVAKKDEIV